MKRILQADRHASLRLREKGDQECATRFGEGEVEMRLLTTICDVRSTWRC